MTARLDLPDAICTLIERTAVVEFATVSTAGVPIDTPVYCFPDDDLSLLGVATGLAYPAKAERARRNPKVGILIEGGESDPVVLMRGVAAVRDADLEANAIRYLSETGFDGLAFGLDWSDARKAIWYWTRLIVEVMPERILWWNEPAAMDRAPQRWDAPGSFEFPLSDPAPTGTVSASSQWPGRDWRAIAQDGMARKVAPHLSLLDKDGVPLPVRARRWSLEEHGFELVMPAGVPWLMGGPASLTFLGLETFIGHVRFGEDVCWFEVERALPQLPMMQDPRSVLQPDDLLKAKLMDRLEHEVRRRGQTMPELPPSPPPLTRLARLRRERAGGGQPMVEIQK